MNELDYLIKGVREFNIVMLFRGELPKEIETDDYLLLKKYANFIDWDDSYKQLTKDTYILKETE